MDHDNRITEAQLEELLREMFYKIVVMPAGDGSTSGRGLLLAIILQ